MKTSIVLGLQWGDEGKGSTTSFLSDPSSLVVRFNGGHQAGHTVVVDGYRHVFSSFGSGTLKGADTFISQYCTINPVAFLNEYTSLRNREVSSKVVTWVHPMAMITTPFDIVQNRREHENNHHGSVGVGFGTTIERNETSPYKLYAVDLFNPTILEYKLMQIARNHYGHKNYEGAMELFVSNVRDILPLIKLTKLEDIKNYYNHIIFEGAQGILLDRDFGFFPHVTRSYCTSRNAMELIKEAKLPKPEVYYVMRAYATRHGNGPFPGEDSNLHFTDETNTPDPFQGTLRFGYHSEEMLNHAITCDSIYSGTSNLNYNLVVTCLDQTGNDVYIDGHCIPLDKFTNMFMYSKLYTSSDPTGTITQYHQQSITASPYYEDRRIGGVGC